jgi:hypothetical protein
VMTIWIALTIFGLALSAIMLRDNLTKKQSAWLSLALLAACAYGLASGIVYISGVNA